MKTKRTEEEILSKGADHAIKVHGLNAEDIFLEYTHAISYVRL
ncbi:MAG: hypothetical protein ACM31M_06265 [Nitrososphaerota archaeon]